MNVLITAEIIQVTFFVKFLIIVFAFRVVSCLRCPSQDTKMFSRKKKKKNQSRYFPVRRRTPLSAATNKKQQQNSEKE